MRVTWFYRPTNIGLKLVSNLHRFRSFLCWNPLHRKTSPPSGTSSTLDPLFGKVFSSRPSVHRHKWWLNIGALQSSVDFRGLFPKITSLKSSRLKTTNHHLNVTMMSPKWIALSRRVSSHIRHSDLCIGTFFILLAFQTSSRSKYPHTGYVSVSRTRAFPGLELNYETTETELQ